MVGREHLGQEIPNINTNYGVLNVIAPHRLSYVVDHLREHTDFWGDYETHPLGKQIETPEDVWAAFILDTVFHTKNIEATYGCLNQCSFCIWSPPKEINHKPFAQFTREVDQLKALREVADIPMYYALGQVSFHKAGETTMYVSPDKVKGHHATAYELARYLVESGLYDESIASPKKDKILRIITAGFFDIPGHSIVSEGIAKIVEEADTVLGSNDNTKGDIKFSMHTGQRYWIPEQTRKPGYKQRSPLWWTPDEWTEILAQNFRILAPLIEQGRLKITIRDIEDTPKNRRMLHRYPPQHAINLADEILRKAGIGSLDKVLVQHPEVKDIKDFHGGGKGDDFEGVASYRARKLQKYGESENNPVCFIDERGNLIRGVPRAERTFRPKDNTIVSKLGKNR